MLRSERTGMDVMVLTPGAVSAEAMLGAVCLPVNCTADQLTVAAGCSQMLELVRQPGRASFRQMPRWSCALPPARRP